MKLVSWNINRASYKRKNFWDFFEKLNFDIGLFQEVYMIPYRIRKNYEVIRGEMKAILLKKDMNAKLSKINVLNINSGNESLFDFCISCEIELIGKTMVLVNIYNYIGPTEDDFLEFSKFLWNYISNNTNKLIIVGGDFNMDEEFQGKYRKWGMVIKNVKENLYKLGYKDVLSNSLDVKSYTFVSLINKKPYQLDYLFIPKNMKINKINTVNENEIFNQKPKLSDHLPIIVTVEL